MERKWTGRQVADVAGIAYDTLHYWVKSGLVKPTYPATKPRNRSYFSWSDILVIAAIKSLREQGISLPKLRLAREELQNRIGVSLAQGLQGGVIIADRDKLLTVLYTFEDAVQIMALLRGGQLILPLSIILEDVKQRAQSMFGVPIDFSRATAKSTITQDFE